MNKSRIAFLIAALLILGPVSASAELIMGGDIEATIQAGTTSVDVQAGTETNVPKVPVETRAPSGSQEGSLESGFLKVKVDGSDLRKTKGLEFDVTSATEVRTDEELKEYAEAQAYAEAAIEKIEIKESEVRVTFSRDARLFGFIPFFISEKASVEMESDGRATVEAKHAWWKFLTKENDRSEAFAALIRTRIAPTVENSLDASLSAAAKARILDGILTSAQATYSAQAQVGTSKK